MTTKAEFIYIFTHGFAISQAEAEMFANSFYDNTTDADGNADPTVAGQFVSTADEAAALFVSAFTDPAVAAEFVSAAGGVVAGQFVSIEGAADAAKFVNSTTNADGELDPTVAAKFVKSDVIYSDSGLGVIDVATGGAIASAAISSIYKLGYELGINDAPLIKQGIHQIDNSTYIVKK